MNKIYVYGQVEEACSRLGDGVDIEEGIRKGPKIIMPVNRCGVCGVGSGKMMKLENKCTLYTRLGVSEGIIFNFECGCCGALSGVSTCTRLGSVNSGCENL